MKIGKIGSAAAVLATAAMIGLAAPADAKPARPGPGIACQPNDPRPRCNPPQHHHPRYHNDWRFNIWFGPRPWGYYDDPWWFGPGYGYYGYYGHPRYAMHTMSCSSAKKILWWNGYSSLRTRDCAGYSYSFDATKNGHKYRITLNARTGSYSRRLIY